MASLNIGAAEPYLWLFSGVLSHVCFFNRGEHHLYVARYGVAFSATIAGSTFLVYRQNDTLDVAVSLVLRTALLYFTGLYSSLLLYRVLLHPLCKFPGPFGARISNFWFSFGLFRGDAYRQLEALHQKHGDFVRIGSSDLSITHPKAVQAIYGRGSKCTKAAWYDITRPMVSLQTLRNRTAHDMRRRVWIPAFSDKALRGYEDRIQVYRTKLLAQIDASNGTPMNMSKWFNLFSFDVMGDLAFGTSFSMLDTSQEHWAIKLLNDGIEPLAWMLPVWFFRLMTAVPGLTRDWWRFIRFAAQRLEDRRRANPDIADIASTLLEPLKGRTPSKQELALLNGDSHLIVVAGSDTTAVTLTHIMLELARHPEHTEKLRKELAPVMTDPSKEVLHHQIFDLNHLSAVIYETLRLHPPVPSALQRLTPPEGIEIDGTYIPGNMTVFCPQYAIGRKEEAYESAKSFIPERWYSAPDMVKEKGAWAPFSAGPYGCIGRPLAMMNIRVTVAKIVMNYDLAFGTSVQDGGVKFERESREHFTLAPAPLDICFTRRAK